MLRVQKQSRIVRLPMTEASLLQTVVWDSRNKLRHPVGGSKRPAHHLKCISTSNYMEKHITTNNNMELRTNTWSVQCCPRPASKGALISVPMEWNCGPIHPKSYAQLLNVTYRSVFLNILTATDRQNV